MTLEPISRTIVGLSPEANATEDSGDLCSPVTETVWLTSPIHFRREIDSAPSISEHPSRSTARKLLRRRSCRAAIMGFMSCQPRPITFFLALCTVAIWTAPANALERKQHTSSFTSNEKIFEATSDFVSSTTNPENAEVPNTEQLPEEGGGLRRKRLGGGLFDVLDGEDSHPKTSVTSARATSETVFAGSNIDNGSKGPLVDPWGGAVREHPSVGIFENEQFFRDLQQFMSMSEAPTSAPRPTTSPTQEPVPSPTLGPTPSPTLGSTPSPTLGSTPLTTSGFTTIDCTDPDVREAEINRVVQSISDPAALADPTSPQSLALNWLLQNDTVVTADPCTYPTVAQRYALAVFYYALDGDNWDDNTEWLGSLSECDWFGISCDEDTDLIIEIELDENNLSGELPPEISQFPKLVQFTLFRNEISGALPSGIQELTDMECLDLEENNFVGSIDTIITPELLTLTQLQKFRVSFNNLTGTITPDISNWGELTQFWAAVNELTGPFPAALGSTATLEEIRLYNNSLEGELPEFNLPNLEVLDISYNILSGNIPEGLYNSTGLEGIFVRANQFTGGISTLIGNLVNLEDLWLDFNGMTGNVPPEIGNLTRLDTLLLGSNMFAGVFPDVLQNYERLDFFDISENNFEGPIPFSVFSIPTIRIVYMSNNTLSGPLQDFSIAQSLRDLYVDGNMLTGGVPDLAQQLVNLTELLLQNNDFTGEMPQSICDLRNTTGDCCLLEDLWVDCSPPAEVECDLETCCTLCFPLP